MFVFFETSYEAIWGQQKATPSEEGCETLVCIIRPTTCNRLWPESSYCNRRTCSTC